jgi:hypothetical protein
MASGANGAKSTGRETQTDDGTRPGGAENGARRHADCRALERVPERKIGYEPGRREPIEEPAAFVSRRRTGPMKKSQHRRRDQDEDTQRKWWRAAREGGPKIGSAEP